MVGLWPLLGCGLSWLAFALLCCGFAQGQPLLQNAGARAPQAATLRVGVAGSAPFVLGTDRPEGLSVDVWRAVAERAGLDYEFRPMRSVPSALDAVMAGQLDLAVGPISITSERAEQVRFTQPYFNSHIGILTVPGSAGAWGHVAPFFGRVFAGTSLLLLLILAIVGLLIWLLERRGDADHFPADPLHGIGNGVWFALVTMTTVGYGDRVPSTVGGRVVASVWMLVALVTTSSLTAGLASAFTVLQLDTASIQSATELQGRRVAVVRGTTGAAFAESRGASLVERRDFDAALQVLERGEAVAVVHDRPMLQYYIAQNPDSALKLVAAKYAPQTYGFAVSGQVPVVRQLNIALLACQESGELRRITRGWLGVVSP